MTYVARNVSAMVLEFHDKVKIERPCSGPFVVIRRSTTTDRVAAAYPDTGTDRRDDIYMFLRCARDTSSPSRFVCPATDP